MMNNIMEIRAHPRPCGEHKIIPYDEPPGMGSSPPVRGARTTHAGDLVEEGLIPARAGSTSTSTAEVLVIRAHPRPCGEHVAELAEIAAAEGSSPPVRGARLGAFPLIPVMGLIPARAGSTPYRGPLGSLAGAHPRPCGEHRSGAAPKGTPPGSSPPVRGARIRFAGRNHHHGLIPARAGSTFHRLLLGLLRWAHPRPCGEHGFTDKNSRKSVGSSPPVRGALMSSGF